MGVHFSRQAEILSTVILLDHAVQCSEIQILQSFMSSNSQRDAAVRFAGHVSQQQWGERSWNVCINITVWFSVHETVVLAAYRRSTAPEADDQLVQVRRFMSLLRILDISPLRRDQPGKPSLHFEPRELGISGEACMESYLAVWESTGPRAAAEASDLFSRRRTFARGRLRGVNSNSPSRLRRSCLSRPRRDAQQKSRGSRATSKSSRSTASGSGRQTSSGSFEEENLQMQAFAEKSPAEYAQYVNLLRLAETMRVNHEMRRAVSCEDAPPPPGIRGTQSKMSRAVSEDEGIAQALLHAEYEKRPAEPAMSKHLPASLPKGRSHLLSL
ncbi:hypothetical protein AK812_SmicGene8207 [Symbiodinium microadriaticum]|uniref:Uncharacterized protein n=1 Tax=Symbiodinium microadriaticum TaxID=2951 RepID=A0A1Q9ELK2_SYMMI|nr:hypothetical protein AK812_SmicGene8207 [Symbiodinium microadriaticum]